MLLFFTLFINSNLAPIFHVNILCHICCKSLSIDQYVVDSALSAINLSLNQKE